jgi:hypothetical protein
VIKTENGFVSNPSGARIVTTTACALLVGGHILCVRAITIEAESIFNMGSRHFHVKNKNNSLAIYAPNRTMEGECQARANERAKSKKN